jgi:16S rRNA (cytosine967-C5)-methyltransferase
MQPLKTLKLHRPIAEQIIDALEQIFGEGYKSDKVIERIFKRNKKLGARDRRFIAETVYDIVRWWRYLWAALGEDPSMDRAALWHMLGAWLVLKEYELPPAEEFADLDRREIERRAEKARKVPAVAESVPDWLYELGVSEFGDDWHEILHELNKPAPVCLRANRLKIERKALLKKLNEEGIETQIAPATDDGLVLVHRKNVFRSESFKLGHFEVQDGASQQVAPMLDIKPGQRVIDACAGAGGKTLHIAALLGNKGKVVAMDVNDKKLEELRRRCTRAGVDVVETKMIESMKSIKRLEASADRVLLDIPCTGLGVLRRNPDAKWRLKFEDIEHLHKLQAEILENYSSMVKPGGRLVYATCSILPSENEVQIQTFLANNSSHWRLIEEKKFRPGENGYDGFYAAALERLKE